MVLEHFWLFLKTARLCSHVPTEAQKREKGFTAVSQQKPASGHKNQD